MLLLCARAQGVATAEEANAAILYEQAAKALPRGVGRAERHVLLDVMATPMNASVEALVHRAEAALALSDRAYEAKVCEWPLPAERPMVAAQPPAVYGLDDFLILRARLRAKRGDSGAAIEDCRRLALLGRRVEQVKSIARYSLGTHLENKAILAAGIVAPDVPHEQFAQFARELDRLPPPAFPADIVEAEKPVFIKTHRRIVEDPKLRQQLEGIGGVVEDMLGEPSSPLKVDDLVSNAGKREATFREIETLFDDMAAALRLPPERRDARWTELEERAKRAHPLTQRAQRVGTMARYVDSGRQIKRDMLEKAVRLFASGKTGDDADAARLAAPYVFARRPNGFTLTHKPKGAKFPHVLTIGPHDPYDWDAIEKRSNGENGLLPEEPWVSRLSCSASIRSGETPKPRIHANFHCSWHQYEKNSDTFPP